ncbi:hypothetical protein Sango_2579000 [Sesamum angolense]|uniref:AtTam37 zinc finger domain-containing protein n=1 Tax=Sesamum angolense TaxID=2727404 RepID=A0AAE1W5M4_9LAMI|nr:hypothetical protein Sango_2579000 [Sesamum angolense]
MTRGTDKLVRSIKKFVDLNYKLFTRRYGQQLMDILEFPVKVVLSPFTLPFDIAGSAPRGFGVPEFISKLSYSAVFAIATLGTYDIAFELGKKVLCQRPTLILIVQKKHICFASTNSYVPFPCEQTLPNHVTVLYVVLTGRIVGPAVDGRPCNVPCAEAQEKCNTNGEKATAENIADAIADNRAELVHLPSSVDLHLPLPSKECPSCDGSWDYDLPSLALIEEGVMKCPECNGKFPLRISADDIMEPPWKACDILRKMDYPYEEVHSIPWFSAG